MAKVADFVGITNEVLEARGVTLPLAGQSTTSSADRFEKGAGGAAVDFRRGAYRRMREAAPANQKHIQRYLSDNCFGDFLTRGGLDVKMRELLTFSMLVSLGGCESQVKGHIAGNANIGQRQGHPAGRRDPVAALYRLSPHAERHCVPERSFAGKIKK